MKPDIKLAVKALRLAYRNLGDRPLVNLSVALALHALTGRKPAMPKRAPNGAKP